MKICDVVWILAVKFADIVISEVSDPLYEDPIKLRYARLRLPIALRFIDLDKFRVIKPINRRVYDIAFIARLEPEKGLPEFICGIKLLYKEGLKPRILVGGEGSLLSLAKEALKNLDVKLVQYIPHKEMPNVLNDVKILVLPSKKEGVPTILLEALACGVIPVASKVGGIPWVIEKAQTGLLLNTPSCNSIYRALKVLLALKPNELERLSIKGRTFAEKYLSINGAINRHALLKKLLKKRAS